MKIDHFENRQFFDSVCYNLMHPQMWKKTNIFIVATSSKLIKRNKPQLLQTLLSDINHAIPQHMSVSYLWFLSSCRYKPPHFAVTTIRFDQTSLWRRLRNMAGTQMGFCLCQLFLFISITVYIKVLSETLLNGLFVSPVKQLYKHKKALCMDEKKGTDFNMRKPPKHLKSQRLVYGVQEKKNKLFLCTDLQEKTDSTLLSQSRFWPSSILTRHSCWTFFFAFCD